MKIDKHSLDINYLENSDDVVITKLNNPLVIDLATAKELVACRLNFTNNRMHYIIMDISNVKKVEAEAKDYFQREDGGLKNILGAAFIANNPVSAMIANIFVKTPKKFEAKFFRNKENALRWIFDYKQKNSQGIL